MQNKNTILSVLVAMALVAAVAKNSIAADEQGDDKPYTVKDGKVDKDVYTGWRTFHSSCFQCHAQDATGSTFAPSLVERLKHIDKARFVQVVAEGYQGQIGVMPGWKNNPNVMPKVDALYAYLKARADGAIPAGKPERLKE